MHLSPKELDHFFYLIRSVSLFICQTDDSFPTLSTIEQIPILSPEDRWDLENEIVTNPRVLKQFLEQNPYDMSEEDMGFIETWRHAIYGEFFLYKLLKNYAVFVHTESGKAYGVLALNDPFDYMVQQIPAYINAVLLPYKDKITYTGTLSSYRLFFGGGIKKSIKEMYDTAKAQYGIITSLPHEEEDAMTLVENRLAFYLKSQSNFYRYEDEIASILKQHPSLSSRYYHLSGKAFARSIADNLRRMGIETGWFGLMVDMIIASGPDKKTLEANIKKILPPDRWDDPYLFQLKKKK